jgi:type IV secretion system protein VirB4
MYLDAVLGARPLVGGFIPRVGPYHVQTITTRAYPTDTVPAMLSALNTIGLPFRMTLRFLPLDKPRAEHELTSYQKKWFMARKSMMTYMMEALQGVESSKINLDAAEKANDATIALTEIQSDQASLGYHTFVVTVWDRDLKELQKKVQTIEKTINAKGFTTLVETVNSTRAWFSTHPGNTRANVRRPLMTSLNFTHLFPSAAVWYGNLINKHFGIPCLFAGVAAGSTPFRFNLHVGDVGHTYIVGPTGAGKSVLLNFIELSWLKYPKAKAFVFDKGKSSYVLAKALGATFYDLKADGSISFQPYANIDKEYEAVWAHEWTLGILEAEKLQVTPDIKAAVWSALKNMATAAKQHRTVSNLSALIQDKSIRGALEAYTTAGPYGRLFDTTTDVVIESDTQYFEMEDLMHSSGPVVQATLMYLFHRLEQQFDGSPTLLVLDEAWTFLDTPQFANQIREWLKVLRKKNVSVVFATQSLADVYESSISSAVLD